MPIKRQGSLVIVGTGIRTVGHLTVEAIAWMKAADRLLYLVADPVAEELIQQLNPGKTETLFRCYGEGKLRLDSYNEMIRDIMAAVRGGFRTCVAFYGHPGVFVYPSHEAIRMAREEGYSAQMLPGISAEDCLFADLGVDPAATGCQSYEATDFMISDRRIDTSASVILWQVGVIGNWGFNRDGYDLSALPILLTRLYRDFPRNHNVIVYEASIFMDCPPTIKQMPLDRIRPSDLSAASTLYIPPGRATRQDAKLLKHLETVLRPTSMRR